MSKQTRKLWKAYVTEKASGRKTGEIQRGGAIKMSHFEGTVLGVDPSLRATGLAVVDIQKGGIYKLLHADTIKVPAKESVYYCLGKIAEICDQVIQAFAIDHVAVEQTIYVQNLKTAMVLGTAKGAALSVFAREALPVFEYPPLRIKQAIVGHGRASKEQVAHMATQLLGQYSWKSDDETDAAAVALCHGFTYREVIGG